MIRGAQILWVDDRPHTVQTVVDQLHTMGALVAIATSNDLALDLVASHKFDLVITDIDRRGGERGTELGIRFAAVGVRVPIIYFVRRVEPDSPLPVGAIAVVNDKSALMDLIGQTLGH